MIQMTDYNAIIQAIRQWPADKRFSLVQEVLQTLAPVTPPRSRRRTADEALGLAAATDHPAPTDEEVKQWMEEHRMEKYDK